MDFVAVSAATCFLVREIAVPIEFLLAMDSCALPDRAMQRLGGPGKGEGFPRPVPAKPLPDDARCLAILRSRWW